MTYSQPNVSFAWPRLTSAVKLLLIINGVVAVLDLIAGGALAVWFGVNWETIASSYGFGLYRLVTYQFVHAFGSPTHILFNMLLLYFFGTMVEAVIGKVRLLQLYLLSGIVGGITQMLLGGMLGIDPRTIGASGSVFGILTYAACMAPRRQVIFLVMFVELRWMVGILVGIGIYMTLVALRVGPTDGVAHGGHLGGALWGFLAFRLARAGHDTFAWVDKVRGWQHNREQQSAARNQEVLDQLLEKVSKEGLNSLTPAERRFLDKTSQQMRRK